MFTGMKKWLLNKLLKHLYKAVTLEELEQSYYKLGRDTQSLFRELAVNQNQLEKWLDNEMTRHAMELIYKKATTADDLMFGRAVLYAVELRKQKKNKLAQIK